MDMITLAMAKAYTDKKAGYSETETVIVIKDSTIPKGVMAIDATFETQLVIGENYIVKFDGVEYETECVFDSISGTPYVGNPGLFSSILNDNGEPFCVDQSENVVLVKDITVSHTISVYQKKETVHPIDPKYLPGVCLPVVELSGELADIGIECTDAEGEALQAAVESGLPCVLNIAAIGISCVATNGGTALIAYCGTETIVCHKIETGKWIVIIQNEG